MVGLWEAWALNWLHMTRKCMMLLFRIMSTSSPLLVPMLQFVCLIYAIWSIQPSSMRTKATSRFFVSHVTSKTQIILRYGWQTPFAHCLCLSNLTVRFIDTVKPSWVHICCGIHHTLSLVSYYYHISCFYLYCPTKRNHFHFWIGVISNNYDNENTFVKNKAMQHILHYV